MSVTVFFFACWTFFWDFCLVNWWAKNCFRVWNLNYVFSHINIYICLVEECIVSVPVSHLPRLNCLPLVCQLDALSAELQAECWEAKSAGWHSTIAGAAPPVLKLLGCITGMFCLCCSGLGGARMYSRWIQLLGCLFPQKLRMWIQTVMCQWKQELWKVENVVYT